MDGFYPLSHPSAGGSFIAILKVPGRMRSVKAGGQEPQFHGFNFGKHTRRSGLDTNALRRYTKTMPTIPLEDTYTDILGKAMRGLHLDEQALAQRAGVGLEELQTLRGGEYSSATVEKIAPILGQIGRAHV